ncbi:hypothetical protein B0H13DRAFT_2017142 [Mycena leptocephala]|nr:hypothetical protein B0H13DRAFT_2017142 [Mycena leptocephala]
MLNPRRLLLALTFFTSSSSAIPLPITPTIHSTGVATCLVILVALLLGLLLLVFLKRLYIQKSRRVNKGRHNSILSLPKGSASALASVDSVSGHNEKAGFLVGFFGSPTVEIQCALEKVEWKEDKQSSFTYQIHTESRRRRLDYPSVLDISRLHNRSVSTPSRAEDRRPVLRESHSFKLPSFPDKARVNPPHSRRFSLPAMNRCVAHDSQRRRHSSLKSARSRRSVSFVPGSPSLRIVDSSSPRLDTPLPLSPRPSEVSTTSPAPSSISASSPKFSSRFSRSFIPPLPPLPFIASPPSPPQRFQISHPYALSPHFRKSVQASPPTQTDPKLEVRQPVPVTDSNFISLELPAMGQLSPTLSSFPSPPPVTSNLKPKLRVRARRSPAIGPSPLRTMILPESLDELSSYAQIRFNKGNSCMKDRPMSVHSPYASPGGTMPVSDAGSSSGTYAGVAKGVSNNIIPKAKRRHSSVSSRYPSKVEEDDPSVLLGIIRELVDETSEWDQSSVFMNQSFKNLLQDSGITPTKSARGGFVVAEANVENMFGFTESDSDQSTRSAEVDLGLLGLDFFKRESFYDVGASKIDHSCNLVSFWDEDSGERYALDFQNNFDSEFTQ